MRIRALYLVVACWTAGVQAADGDCSISLLAGSVYGHSQHVHESTVSTTNLTTSFGIDGNGAGVGFGCRWRNGPWVGGFETDFMKTSTKGSAQDVIGIQSETEIENTATLRLTGGYMLRPKLLVYLTGGLATASVKAALCPSPSSCTSESHRLYGGAFGGGFEYLFTTQISARLEAIWIGLDNRSYFDPPPAGAASRNGGVSPDIQTIRAGLSWHF